MVLDLDTFSRNFEAEERARLRAEEEERQRKAEELRRRSEAETRKIEAFMRQRESAGQKGGAASDTGLRRGALDLLKKKASTRPAVDPAVLKKDKADADLDQSMRAALHYLAEVGNELNVVHPTAECPYDYVFLGRLPRVRLSNAFVDLRSRKISGKDHGEHLFVKFQVQPTSPAKATLLGADIARCSEFLKMLNVAFDAKAEAKSDFGQVTRATFEVSAPLPCELHIRADYDKSSVEIELVNVRRPGRVRCQIEPKALDEVVDDLARYILGVDDDFDKVLDRR